MQLEELKKLSDEELEGRMSERLAHVDEVWPDERGTVLAEAEVYMRVLERRHDSHVSKRDFWMEVGVMVLIGAEIVMSIRAELLQKQNFKDEEAIFQRLQSSSDATAQHLVSAGNALKTMNEKLQLELDLYYEPSVRLEYRSQYGYHILTVHNNGRSSITVFGVKVHDLTATKIQDRVCRLENPLTIPGGLSRDLESNFVIKDVVQAAVNGGGFRPFSFYFRAENGKEFEHRVRVFRVPLSVGEKVTVDNRNTEPVAAQTTRGTCPD